MKAPPGLSIMIRSSIGYQKGRHPLRVSSFLVDSKGIEPSNLTDANRALSQLSYEPSQLSYEPVFASPVI